MRRLFDYRPQQPGPLIGAARPFSCADTFLPVTPLGRIPAKVPTGWKLAHETTVDQAATLAKRIDALRLFDTQALLHDERITLVGSPLLVEWRNCASVP
jgi:hypothetical protein